LSGIHKRRERHGGRFTAALLGGLAVGALGLAPATAAATDDLATARAILQESFARASVTDLRPLLPDAGRVALALPSLGHADGHVSADQCFYLLGELFERITVKSFVLTSAGKINADADSHRARGHLVIRLPDGGDRRLEIHFLLAREGSGWRLREVRENYRD